MQRILLNIADVCERSRVNGPGLRSVVWVQGCTIGCPGCFNPHTHPHRPMRLTDPKDLALHLLQIPDTDGITISGGEPFEQAEACVLLAQAIQNGGRTVVVFTGYRFEVLAASRLAAVQRFLASIDLLIAGPYIQSLHGDGSRWRGSSNQTVHALTDRYRDELEDAVSTTPLVEIATDGASQMETGFPDEDDRRWIDKITGAVPTSITVEAPRKERTKRCLNPIDPS
jgi:anaerobic ribonucleoside-triphosphate reductase activating protein